MWYLSCNFYSIQFAHLCKEVFNLVVVSTSFFPASTPLFFLLLYIIGIFIHATFVFFLMANLFWRLKFIWNEKCQRWNAHEGQEQEPSKEKDECFVSQQDCKSSDSTVHKDFHISWLCVKFSLCFFKPSSKVLLPSVGGSYSPFLICLRHWSAVKTSCLLIGMRK